VDNKFSFGDVVFGQAMQDKSMNNTSIKVRVRGVCVFSYKIAHPELVPTVDGVTGVICSDIKGHISFPYAGKGKGINLKVNREDNTVEVLM
jgi:hypothetical protein